MAVDGLRMTQEYMFWQLEFDTLVPKSEQNVKSRFETGDQAAKIIQLKTNRVVISY